MALRQVIRIDEDKCDGCGECVTSCAEGAIAIRNGKARLVSATYCDGLGVCLGHCPQGAITIEEREAAAFDAEETKKHLAGQAQHQTGAHSLPLLEAMGHCPGSMVRSIGRTPAAAQDGAAPAQSELGNWPVQLALIPPTAPYLRGADLLLVADCVPFAYADFHRRFLRGNPVVIGCPKLDQPELYVQKMTEILGQAGPRSLTVVHMEVPCCSGLTRIAEHALAAARRDIPFTDVTIGIHGEVLAHH
jgi:Pyruvate/2-oxoacid:ferredoxin oxidoreductase delta subunit